MEPACQTGGFEMSHVGSEEPWKVHELKECPGPVCLDGLGVTRVLP